MGRVYFHDGRDEFIFASEAKSLQRLRPALRAIEMGSIAEYLRFNCVTRNKSLFKGISLLPSGSSWDFPNEALAVRRRRYFQFNEWEQQKVLEMDELYQKFSETVSKVFPAYAEAPTKIGFSLIVGLRFACSDGFAEIA